MLQEQNARLLIQLVGVVGWLMVPHGYAGCLVENHTVDLVNGCDLLSRHADQQSHHKDH